MFIVWASLAWAEPATYVPDPAAATAYQAAVDAGAAAAKSPKPADAAAIARGESTYSSQCAVCHGVAGHGDGMAAAMLDPHPADFTDAARWSASSLGTKHWVVMNGILGTGMIARGLDADRAWDVLAYIDATFQHHAPISAPAPRSP